MMGRTGLGRAGKVVALGLMLVGVMFIATEAPPEVPQPTIPPPLEPDFPRIAALYSKGDGQNTVRTQAAISRLNLYVSDMINWPAVSAKEQSLTQGRFYKYQNPSLIALMYFHACIYSDTEYTPGQFTVQAATYYIDPQWYLTYAGSTLAEDIAASSDTLPVWDLSVFSVGDRIMLGGVANQSRAELSIVTAKSSPSGAGTLTVVRGVLSQRGKFKATNHAAGTYVRPIAHAFGSGESMVLNITAYGPTSWVNAEFGHQTWNQFVASFLARKLDDPDFSNVNGYMLDNFVDRATAIVDHPERIDLYNTNTPSGLPDSAWSEGMRDLASRVRSRLPPDRLLVANNGGQDAETLGQILNGGMIEGLDDSGSSEMHGELTSSLSFYGAWMQHARRPRTFIVNGSPRAPTLQSGERAYQSMRFLLTQTLMNDGYFAFDELNINGGHQTLWWFDEYDNAGRRMGYLGQALGPAVQPIPGVHRRDFANGIALSNATDDTLRIDLGGTFRRIRGSQAPSVNDGARVRIVRLPPQDGVILLRN